MEEKGEQKIEEIKKKKLSKRSSIKVLRTFSFPKNTMIRQRLCSLPQDVPFRLTQVYLFRSWVEIVC